MNTYYKILKEAGLSGLTAKQWILIIWFSVSLIGLTMNEDAPLIARLIVIVSVITSGYFCKKHIKIEPNEY